MSGLFGTDGVRGEANRDLAPELALKLGQACSRLVEAGGTVLVGRDTRRSGSMIQSALSSGITSVGLNVLDAGIIPTPALPLLEKHHGASLAAMISASHNLARDNGIKFFNSQGYKLSEDAEEQIEKALASELETTRVYGSDIGKVCRLSEARNQYLDLLKGSVVEGHAPFKGLKVLVDCANGATYCVAPGLLRDLGANVSSMGDQPDGDNINLNCGSTEMEALKQRMEAGNFDVGVAYDGDGDRALFVDENGAVVDGDQVLFLVASWLQKKDLLNPPLVIATVMSNLGLEKSLEKMGVELLRVQVGDRFVAEKLREAGALAGGEQSGHIIFPRYSPTGDGLITTLQILKILVASGEPLSELADRMEWYPQVLENVETENKNRFSLNGAIGEAIEEWEEILGDRGRILVRPSGTQSVIRVMVEASDKQLTARAAKEIAGEIERELN
ncbi:MAG: phosphoglucosamine mutase [Candidatus Acetothermia bacterium]